MNEPFMMAESHGTQPEDLSYIDNMERRHTLLDELQTIPLVTGNSNSPNSCINRKYITEAVWAAFWVAPVEEIQHLDKMMKENGLYLYMFQTVLFMLDSGVSRLIRTVLRGSRGNASSASVCKALEMSGLDSIWGSKLVDDFTSALSTDSLNSPANMVTLDSNVRYLWAKNKLSIEPYDWDGRSIRLRLRLLKGSKLIRDRHCRERFPWRNDLAMKPTEVVEDTVAEDELVYEGTQVPIRDGDILTYRLDDPACRLDPRLLCFWHKICVMASLVGCDERDDQACLEFAQGLADKVEEGEVEENERREEVVRVWKQETAQMRGVYETDEGEERMEASE